MEINKFLSEPHDTFSLPLLDEKGQFSWVSFESTWVDANLTERVDRTVTFLLKEMEDVPQLDRLYLMDSFAIRFCLFCPQNPDACYSYKKTIWSIGDKCTEIYEEVTEILNTELWEETGKRAKEEYLKTRADRLQKEMNSAKRMNDDDAVKMLEGELAKTEFDTEAIVRPAVAKAVRETVQKQISAEKEVVDTVFKPLVDPKKDRKVSVELLDEYYCNAGEYRYKYEEILPNSLKSKPASQPIDPRPIDPMWAYKQRQDQERLDYETASGHSVYYDQRALKDI